MFSVNVVLFERPRCRIEYSVYDHMRKRMISVLQQVFPCDPVVSVMIKLPKATVQNIEMFVTEISSHFVDVFLFIDQWKWLEKIRPSNLSWSYSSRMALIDRIKYSCDHSDCVFLLEFGVIWQKFQALKKDIMWKRCEKKLKVAKHRATRIENYSNYSASTNLLDDHLIGPWCTEESHLVECSLHLVVSQAGKNVLVDHKVPFLFSSTILM